MEDDVFTVWILASIFSSCNAFWESSFSDENSFALVSQNRNCMQEDEIIAFRKASSPCKSTW